jgi:hypothetical protein
MVDYIQLVNTLTTTLRTIPELVQELPNADPNRIVAYIDRNPVMNTLTNTIYEMKSGIILVTWEATRINDQENDAGMWVHKLIVYCRSDTGKSALDMVKLVIDGIPNPGDGQRWRNCAIMAGVLPVKITEALRTPDREGIDFYPVEMEFKETGDA